MSDINRLVDDGVAVVVFKNEDQSYTALAVRPDHEDLRIVVRDAGEDGHLIAGVTSEKALARLTEVMRCDCQEGHEELINELRKLADDYAPITKRTHIVMRKAADIIDQLPKCPSPPTQE